MKRQQSHYDLLGVRPDASAQEIRAAFLALAHQFHPDLNSNRLEADETFKQLRTAYETLAKPSTRRAYDSKINAFSRKPVGRSEYVVPNRPLQTVWLNDPTKRRERVLFGLGFVIMVAVFAIGILVQEQRLARQEQRLAIQERRIAHARKQEFQARNRARLVEQNKRSLRLGSNPSTTEPNASSSTATSGSQILGHDPQNEQKESIAPKETKDELAAMAFQKKKTAVDFSDLMLDLTHPTGFQSAAMPMLPAVLRPTIEPAIPELSLGLDDVFSKGVGTSVPFVPVTQTSLMPKDPLFENHRAWEGNSKRFSERSLTPSSADSNYRSSLETRTSSYEVTPAQGFGPTNDFLPVADYSQTNIPMPRFSGKSGLNSAPANSRSSAFSPNLGYDFGYGRRNLLQSLRSVPPLKAKGRSNQFGSPRLQTNSFPSARSYSSRSAFPSAPVTSGLPPEYQH